MPRLPLPFSLLAPGLGTIQYLKYEIGTVPPTVVGLALPASASTPPLDAGLREIPCTNARHKKCLSDVMRRQSWPGGLIDRAHTTGLPLLIGADGPPEALKVGSL